MDKNSVHNLGSFAVNLDRGEAEEEAGDDGSIRFLKEQQWQVDFALAP
ncbi:MAG: hypothetical protein GWN58_39680, partial [Anaerolineae bacterium]|nr:hypothetical protein [Anaerolineae bacterium]